MKKIYIVGAGGFGRELYWWLAQSPDRGRAWTLAGFLDDNAGALSGFDYPAKVVGPILGYCPKPGDLLAVAVSQPKAKKPVVDALLSAGAEFLTYVHPQAHVGGNVKLGRGTIVCPGAILTCDIVVGEFTTINVNATIGHDARVGDFCLISPHCDITGFVHVGNGVFMGTHAHIIPKIKVGNNAILGAGTTVISNVDDGATIVGNPGSRIK
jgi:sugar O-acyltransferase (sialic acid O-acetyltransferase NeuD family)